MEFSDSKLIEMVREKDENAKDYLYQKYRYIIETELKKYSFVSKKFGIDYHDLYWIINVMNRQAGVSVDYDKLTNKIYVTHNDTGNVGEIDMIKYKIQKK